MSTEDLQRRLARRAVVLDIGGFRPPDDPSVSWFGVVKMCAKGEEWPRSGGEPMFPICQVNLTGLPFRPARLDDLEFFSVFMGPGDLPSNEPNGSGWLIRTYRSLSDLVPLNPMATGSPAKALPMKARTVERDYPCYEDIDEDLLEDIEDRYYDLFENADGFKLGGWPSLIQSEIYWAPWNQHPAKPEYVFQIDSTEKGNWQWGDNGVAYFGRGTHPEHQHEWTFEWQCY